MRETTWRKIIAQSYFCRLEKWKNGGLLLSLILEENSIELQNFTVVVQNYAFMGLKNNDTIAWHIDRIVDMLYKLAVSIEKQKLIASGEYDDYYESYIEEVAEENVKKRHGKL